jgi:hypothetical protein
MGWSAREVRESCGWTSAAYRLGDCRLGWGFYALGGCGGALFVCALLSTNAAHPVLWKKVRAIDIREMYSQTALLQPPPSAPSNETALQNSLAIYASQDLEERQALRDDR